MSRASEPLKPNCCSVGLLTEQVTTSWFNSNAKDYKRITIWASPFTNSPPSYLADAFRPNVDTVLLYSTVTNGESVLHFIRAEQNIKTSR